MAEPVGERPAGCPAGVGGVTSAGPGAGDVTPAAPGAREVGDEPSAAGGGGTPGAPDLGRTNLAWALALLDGLVRAGVEHVVACPGSRSTPLALAAARHPGVRLWVQLDERSAAFFALGLGRATGRPAAVVATSGTAPANFYPAVIESRYGRVPLVVLSADRPHELREFGASQTVDQVHLYGRHAKWFADLPLPEDEPAARAYVTRVGVRAVAEALAAPAGPVHLNVPFREPLVPASPEEPVPAPGALEAQAPGAPLDAPLPVEPRLAPAALTESEAHELLSLLAGARRGLIVCGPVSPVLAVAPGAGAAAGGGGGAPVTSGDGPPLAIAVTQLAERLGLPVLADPLSGLRCGPHLDPAHGASGVTGPAVEGVVIDAYDAFLRDPALAEALAPDLILRLGGMPVSKPLAQFLERHRGPVHVVIDEGGWPDPGHVATHVVRADPARACRQLAELAAEGLGDGAAGGGAAGGTIPAAEAAAVDAAAADAAAPGATPAGGAAPGGPARETPARGAAPGVTASAVAGDGTRASGATGAEAKAQATASGSWLTLWQRLNRTARQAIARRLAQWDEPAEPRIVAELAHLLPGGTLLFAGNSMPVRDVDTFFPATPRHVRILANRGAAGIDGVVSTAAGAAAAGEGPVVLLIGDLSFYHDLNGLWAAARYGLPLVTVVVNNDGGGIFSFLPQARLDPGEFEPLWGTPHGLDFRHAAALYGIPYRRVDTWGAFRAAVQEALARAAGKAGTGARAGARAGAEASPEGPAPTIIEIRTNRERNVDHHRQVWRAVAAALAGAGLAPQGGAGSASAGTRVGGAGDGRVGPGPAGRPEGGRATGGRPRGAGFVRVRGARYYIEAAGWPPRPAGRAGERVAAREPALLLHGFTGSAASWAGVWDELAAAGPVLAVDLLGHGRSAAPADPARYRMEEQVADLLALLDRLGVPRVHLVGYSMGGRVALGLAAATPARVASLVLESSSPGLADPTEREARRRADEALARRIEEEGIAAFTRSWEELPLFAGLRRLAPATRVAVRANRLAQRPRGLAGSLRGMGAGVQPPLWDRLQDLPMPVLCLAGAGDAKYVALARAMAARLPRGRAVIVPGAGHTVHLEEPAAFVKEVRAFWREHRP